MNVVFAPERGADRSISPRCPRCSGVLPRVVSVEHGEERTVELLCGCGFTISYIGPGLIVDRRASPL